MVRRDDAQRLLRRTSICTPLAFATPSTKEADRELGLSDVEVI